MPEYQEEEASGSAACFGAGAPGPSALQHHTLLCWTERLLGGQAGGQHHRTSLFRSSGRLGEAAQRELAGFHSALLRWPALLAFPATLKQVHAASVVGTYHFEHVPCSSACFPAWHQVLLCQPEHAVGANCALHCWIKMTSFHLPQASSAPALGLAAVRGSTNGQGGSLLLQLLHASATSAPELCAAPFVAFADAAVFADAQLHSRPLAEAACAQAAAALDRFCDAAAAEVRGRE